MSKFKSSLKNGTGITLIELCVAMAMTTIVIAIIFTTWNSFNRHFFNQRRKGALQGELRQITATLNSHIRRSPAVLSWHSNGITYVSPDKGDTIVYEFYDEHLLINEEPLPIISQEAFISDFSLEEVEQSIIHERREHILLSIQVTLENAFGNQATLSSTIAAKMVDEEDGAKDSWNF